MLCLCVVVINMRILRGLLSILSIGLIFQPSVFISSSPGLFQIARMRVIPLVYLLCKIISIGGEVTHLVYTPQGVSGV